MGVPEILSVPWPFVKSRFHCSLLFSIKYDMKYDYEFLTCILRKMTLRGKKALEMSSVVVRVQNLDTLDTNEPLLKSI